MENIRKKYKVLTLFITVLLSCSIIVIFSYHMSKIFELYMMQGEKSIIEEKKIFIRDGVNNLISDFTDAKQNELELNEGLCEETAVYLLNYYRHSPEEFPQLCAGYFSAPQNIKRLEVLIENTDTGEILYKSDKIPDRGQMEQLEWVTVLKTTLATYHHRSFAPYEIYWGTGLEYLEEQQLERTYEIVETTKFSEDNVLWITEVLDSDGGKNFAIRRFDSRNPYGQDEFLSSDWQDVDGKKYYEEALTHYGSTNEFFIKSKFYNPKIGRIEEFMTYSVLYPEYNWIVTVGAPSIDRKDFDKLLTDKKNPILKVMAVQILLALVAIIAFGLGAQMLIERWYYNRSGKKLTEQVNQDPLTKIYNRRAAVTCLETTFEKFKDIEENSTVIMMDIDDFKKINDTFGHDFGDQVLIRMTDTVLRHIRSTDVFARWGGEEFLLICYGLKPEYLEYFARKILDAVRNVEHSYGEDHIRVSVSMGISFYEQGDSEYATAVKRADVALYRAKENGKDQAVISILDEIIVCS